MIEAVLDRSEVRCAAIVNSDRRLVAGAGAAADLVELAKVAQTVARGGVEGLEASLDADDDIIAREVDIQGETLVIAAFGTRVRRLPAAVDAIARICAG